MRDDFGSAAGSAPFGRRHDDYSVCYTLWRVTLNYWRPSPGPGAAPLRGHRARDRDARAREVMPRGKRHLSRGLGLEA
eukprot:scaffold19870_cov39-Phaeocystis_antarctica.AAC.1